MAGSINEERVKKTVEEILEKIQSDVDPALLNVYRSFLRKKVSFFRRSYFGAYLLMLLDQGGGLGKRTMSLPPKTRRDEAPPRKSNRPDSFQPRDNVQAEPNRNPLPEEDSTRLFISIGRNRRVFPREIMGLITSKTSVSREDIGIIRILDNYSFVQVRRAAADTIIEALNGVMFRGRTLTVNFARTKKEEALDERQDEAPEEATPYVSEEDGEGISYPEPSRTLLSEGEEPQRSGGEGVLDSRAAEAASTTHSLQNKAVGLEASLRDSPPDSPESADMETEGTDTFFEDDDDAEENTAD
jgi:hypothetical protein